MKRNFTHTADAKPSLLVVLGGGESGLGAALLGKQHGWRVLVSDLGGIKEKYKSEFSDAGIPWEEGGHSEDKLLRADLIVKSPGIPDNAAIVSRLRGNGKKIVSEIEFAASHTDSTLIGITGTNGKTTTALLTHHMLSNAGFDVGLAGNIGRSFALQLVRDPRAFFVLELSSFQLEGVEKMSPHIAVLTNIAPDHLDRHQSYEAYVASKFQLIKNQTDKDYFIYDGDNQDINSWLSQFPIKSKKLPFSLTRIVEQGAYVENNELHITLENTRTTMSSPTLTQKGVHNTKNAMAAATVAKLLKIRKETIRESMESFQGVEHRLEEVLKVNKVQYINDSKATNINATYYALQSIETEVIWIAGGVDKGNDYSELFPLVNSRVKAIICIGLDNTRLLQVFGSSVDLIVECGNMEDAVAQAYRIAEKGNTVLLSPACASYDLYESYEERGRQFKEAVRNL